MKLIPGADKAEGPQLVHIKDLGTAKGFGASTIAIGQVDEEVKRMHLLARDNLHAALEALFDPRTGDIESVYQKEEIIS
jgi:phosphate uptake regulator